MNKTVTFTCGADSYGDVMRRAVRAYGRALRENGADLRNYAPANEDGAGFGWDAVVRAAMDMSPGSRTVMSGRMADALRKALSHMIEHRTGDAEERRAAFRMRMQLDDLLSWEQKHESNGS